MGRRSVDCDGIVSCLHCAGCHIEPPEILVRDRLIPASIPIDCGAGVHFHCVAAFWAFAWTYPQFHPVIFGTITVVVGGNPVLVGRQPRFLG